MTKQIDLKLGFQFTDEAVRPEPPDYLLWLYEIMVDHNGILRQLEWRICNGYKEV